MSSFWVLFGWKLIKKKHSFNFTQSCFRDVLKVISLVIILTIFSICYSLAFSFILFIFQSFTTFPINSYNSNLNIISYFSFKFIGLRNMTIFTNVKLKNEFKIRCKASWLYTFKIYYGISFYKSFHNINNDVFFFDQNGLVNKNSNVKTLIT